MANKDSTAQNNATPEQLAEQYPDNCDPFGIWYFINAESLRYKWVVNDENGDAFTETTNHKTALILSDALKIRHEKINNGLLLNAEQQREINRALLIGLDSFGEIERVTNAIKMTENLTGIGKLPKSVHPLHPTGSTDTVGMFVAAMRFMQQV